ncbi:MAG: zinc ribbon domain-containing protein [Chlamydiae bacterium]|nr:zinc ribbon domain-containing protein [Chlamydiota bacterium]
MQEALKVIIHIQDFDMKMMRLMRLKKERQKELQQIDSLRKELYQQYAEKEKEIVDLDKTIQTQETKIQDIAAKIKRIENQQSNIKKADEFTALTQEMTAAEREKTSLEQKVSDLVDKKNAEEELLDKIKTSLQNSEESSKAIEKEIESSIELINAEGSAIKQQRDELAKQASPDLLALYERLLKNKKDRVIVPIENRTCSGCHIVLTAQHENLVRKGENLVFCEHCSRIHYWQEARAESEENSTGKRRRRRATTA